MCKVLSPRGWQYSDRKLPYRSESHQAKGDLGGSVRAGYVVESDFRSGTRLLGQHSKATRPGDASQGDRYGRNSGSAFHGRATDTMILLSIYNQTAERRCIPASLSRRDKTRVAQQFIAGMAQRKQVSPGGTAERPGRLGRFPSSAVPTALIL